MILSRKRAAALVAAAAAALPLLVAAPAGADASSCHLLLAGPTPSAEVDLDDDGNPEVRVPSLRDVTLCVGADVVLTDRPDWWSEPCAEWGTCWRFFVHYGLSGYADAGAQLCYTVDGVQRCTKTLDVHVPINAIQGGTMCIGVDLQGGFPCSGGQAISFE